MSNDNRHLVDSLRNKVVCDDTLKVLKRFPDNCLEMIYSEPDYNVGINYTGKKYTMKWDEYIEWYIELIKESMRVLKPNGNLFTMNYPRQNAHLWVNCLEHIAYDVHEYVWVYNTNTGHSPRYFTTAHRTILHATKSKSNHFYKDQVSLPYQNPKDPRIIERIENGSKGRMPYSWFYHNLVKNISKDKTIHACQIPLKLVERLILASTKENDDVFILFGGSGSELVLCKELKRNFISCEIHPLYYQMIQSRLKNGGKIEDEYRLECAKRKQNKNYVERII